MHMETPYTSTPPPPPLPCIHTHQTQLSSLSRFLGFSLSKTHTQHTHTGTRKAHTHNTHIQNTHTLSLGSGWSRKEETLTPITPILHLHASSKTIQTNTKNFFISSCLPKFRTQVVVARSVASNSSNVETVVSKRHLSNVPKGLRRDLLSKHVAVILDGNRRWGQERGLSVDETHRAGGKKLAEIATLCRKWGVKVLTAFAFSTENWTRPKEEVDILMNLFGEQMPSYLGDTTSVQGHSILLKQKPHTRRGHCIEGLRFKFKWKILVSLTVMSTQPLAFTISNNGRLHESATVSKRSDSSEAMPEDQCINPISIVTNDQLSILHFLFGCWRIFEEGMDDDGNLEALKVGGWSGAVLACSS